ncbi:MAG: hypothetical protein PHY31_04245 [Smithellaceae bacterium]|nr:hypothetical protein [Smithellaceae bacterium]
MMDRKPSCDRRSFLKNAAILGGLTFLLDTIKPARARRKQPTSPPDIAGQGYRETEHVKKYYETARL